MKIDDYITDLKKIDKKFYHQFEQAYHYASEFDTLVTIANERLIHTLGYVPILLDHAMKKNPDSDSSEEKQFFIEYLDTYRNTKDELQLFNLGMRYLLFLQGKEQH